MNTLTTLDVVLISLFFSAIPVIGFWLLINKTHRDK